MDMTGLENMMVTAGSGMYLVSAGIAWRTRNSLAGSFLLVGALFIAVGIAARWLAAGQGPFLTMYEVLVSSLFSLGLLYGLAYLKWPRTRWGGRYAIVVLILLALWSITADPTVVPLPASYENPWLWVHVALGKLFLTCSLVAMSLAFAAAFETRRKMVRTVALDDTAWGWMMAGLVFHSGMLVAGAVWAQSAWGRYWAWDPLETWAFGTWLLMVVAVHLRFSGSLSPRFGRALIAGTFVLAFLTFFGVPFLSSAPHKGAV
jgi:ABC-type transport system involved in cytochrome c biogenesis permease subunit